MCLLSECASVCTHTQYEYLCTCILSIELSSAHSLSAVFTKLFAGALSFNTPITVLLLAGHVHQRRTIQRLAELKVTTQTLLLLVGCNPGCLRGISWVHTAAVHAIAHLFKMINWT